MNHDGPLAGAVRSDVLEVEALREVEVALDGTALPLPAQRVADLEVNLGAVERSSSLVHRVAPSLPLQGLGQRAGRKVPDVVGADGLFGSGTEVDLIVGEAKLGEHVLREVEDLEDLVLDLVGQAKHMCIVLGKTSHAKEAGESARPLVAVDCSQLRPADGQLAVGALGVLVHEDMEGAVHGLDLVDLLLNVHLVEHALRVELEVSRLLPQIHVGDVGAVHQLVSAPHVQVLPEGLDDIPHPSSLGVPEHQPSSCLLLDAKEVHLLSQLAVISPLRLFHHVLVRLELRLVLPCRPVDALQRSFGLVSSPVCAGHSLQLDRLPADVSSRLHVRPRAQVPPLLSDVVDADILSLRDRVQQLQLVRLFLRFDPLPRLLPRNDLAPDRKLLVDDLLHFLLDGLEVLLLEAVSLQVEVVEEPVLDPRPNGHLCLGEQTLDGHGHNVCGRVTDLDELGAFVVGWQRHKLHLLLALLLLRARGYHPEIPQSLRGESDTAG
mmetsp:Transcript_22390/g.50453  ORF Transcript_22390/g.50453 Transcript_22390/m.50453 type:complete len:493 (-) Transcript_22390:197-1675(-)